jgi:membrane protein YdbS with pleckstrin-like domain
VKKLHPKAVWLFFLQKVLVLVFMILFLVGPMLLSFGFSLWSLRSPRPSYYRDDGFDRSLRSASLFSFYGIWGLLLFLIVVSFIWSKLYYESFKFELAEKGLKIESGVIWKKYITIPYERVQNVDIYRGPLARILGLSDIHVQTAGISGAMITEGRIPGLSPKDAEEMREKLVGKISGGQGL